MFNLFKKRRQSHSISDSNKHEFKILLTSIGENLYDQRLYGQKKVVDHLLLLIDNDSISEFVIAINGIDMWGGAGAVWEVHIENENKRAEFESNLVNLIKLMEDSQIMGRRSKSVRRILNK